MANPAEKKFDGKKTDEKMLGEKKLGDKKLGDKKFKVTQMRSTSRATNSQVATLKALGLRGRHHSVILADNPANRGQVVKIQHMLNVEVVR